jgi:hypothetical protein
MSEGEIVKVENESFLSPVATLDQLGDRYDTFKKFVKERLHQGVDFQVIPGTEKPSLVKPGAEKLCTLFGLSAMQELTSKIEDWTGKEHGEPFFKYDYLCTLSRNGKPIASCEGSCNSWEKKYRYRSQELKCPKCGKQAIIKGKVEYGGGWLCFAKKGGCGAKFLDGDKTIEDQPRGQVPNPDIADQVNTLQKMAQKRAFVGATLIATNASEYFTQDMEDIKEVVDAEYHDVSANAEMPKKTEKEYPMVKGVASKVESWQLLTREQAEDTLSHDGVRYGDIAQSELEKRFIGISKKLRLSDLPENERAELQGKYDAITALRVFRGEEKK